MSHDVKTWAKTGRASLPSFTFYLLSTHVFFWPLLSPTRPSFFPNWPRPVGLAMARQGPHLTRKKLPAASGLTRQWPTKDVTSFVISGCESLHGEMLNEKLTNIHQQSTPYSSTNTNLEDPNKKMKIFKIFAIFSDLRQCVNKQEHGNNRKY